MRLPDDRVYNAILFGLRSAAAALLALLVAFTLQLDEPGWAGTSAIIVAQPVLGATLRKGSLRLIGTFVGAWAGVLLFVCFPQDRIGFLTGLAVWAAACSVVGTLLGDVLAYAPLLASYTCAIVAMSAVADPPGVFLLGVARAASISLGITSTALVFSLTDFGKQRAAFAAALSKAAAEARSGLVEALQGSTADLAARLAAGQAKRRALVARVASFDMLMDQAIGENLDLRSRVGVLRRAVAGLLLVLSAWRGVEQHRRRAEGAEQAVEEVGARLQIAIAEAADEPSLLMETGRSLEREPATTVNERLLMDRVAHALEGMSETQAGLRLLRTPLRAPEMPGLRPIQPRNPYTAALNGVRSLVAVGLAAVIWVATGWTSGPNFLIFTIINVVLFGVRGEAAYSGAAAMAISCAVDLVLAAALQFAVVPLVQGLGFDSYGAFCLVLGIPLAVLGTIAALMPAGHPSSALAFMTFANLIPLLAPTNEITYDFATFLNNGVAILAGATFGAAAHRLLPPLPRPLRSWLFLRDARRDLRRIVRKTWRPEPEAWEARQYARLVGLPPDAPMLDIARHLAALSVGLELLRSQEPGAADELRRQASEAEIAEAVASHPDFFRGLGLPEAAKA